MKMNDLVHNEERLKQLRERAKELIAIGKSIGLADEE